MWRMVARHCHPVAPSILPKSGWAIAHPPLTPFSLCFALNLFVLFIVAAKTKRQPWDLKGKMDDMQGEMRTAMERIMALETEKTTLQTNVEEKTVVVAQNSEELDAQKRQCKQLNEELDDMRRKMRKMQVCTY